MRTLGAMRLLPVALGLALAASLLGCPVVGPPIFTTSSSSSSASSGTAPSSSSTASSGGGAGGHGGAGGAPSTSSTGGAGGAGGGAGGEAPDAGADGDAGEVTIDGGEDAGDAAPDGPLVADAGATCFLAPGLDPTCAVKFPDAGPLHGWLCEDADGGTLPDPPSCVLLFLDDWCCP